MLVTNNKHTNQLIMVMVPNDYPIHSYRAFYLLKVYLFHDLFCVCIGDIHLNKLKSLI